jgi:toxin ParE1/3/4
MAGSPSRFKVLLTEGAEQDLEALHEHIAEFDCVASANYVLDKLMEVVERLSRFLSVAATLKSWSPRIKEYRQFIQTLPRHLPRHG